MVKAKSVYSETGRKLSRVDKGKSGGRSGRGRGGDDDDDHDHDVSGGTHGVKTNVVSLKGSRGGAAAHAAFDESHEEFDDEMDAFHRAKWADDDDGEDGKKRKATKGTRSDHVVTAGTTRRKQASSAALATSKGSDDDDSDDGDDGVEEVMGLDMYDDDDDDDDDDEDEDDDEDDDDEDDDEKEVSWGKSKRDYYNADDASDQATDSEDEEQMEREEEQEALRIQKQLAQLMDEEQVVGKSAAKTTATKRAKDLGHTADEDDDERDASFESRASKTKSQSPKSKAAVKASSNNNSSKSGNDGNDDDDDSVAVETVARDLAALSTEEKLELIVKDSPELLELVGELHGKIEDVSSQILPLLEKAKRGEFATNKGVSYLEVKFHLLLTYCINIAFYLLLKSEGKQVKDHPVIEHLVRLRTIIERLRPLDSKLKYQIDKLVKVAATGSLDSLDATRFKANPKALVSKLGDNDEDEGALAAGGGRKSLKARGKRAAASDDEAASDYDGMDADADGGAASSGKYVPPKMASVAFDGDSATNKKLQREEKLKRKALKSSLLKDIQEEFSDRPREVRDTSGFGGKDVLPNQDEEDYRRRFEEDHFVRLTTKKKSGKAPRLRNELNDLVDFGDINGLDRLVGRNPSGNDIENDEELRKVFKKSSVRDKLNAMRNRDRDEDESGGQQSRKKGRFDAPVEEDDYYKEILSKTEKRKEQKAADKASRNVMAADGDDSQEEGKRAISYQIAKNKGLTPKRKKEVRNPRVKHRMGYEKALMKRKSQVPTVQTSAGNYGGESTGIRTGLARSVPLA